MISNTHYLLNKPDHNFYLKAKEPSLLSKRKFIDSVQCGLLFELLLWNYFNGVKSGERAAHSIRPFDRSNDQRGVFATIPFPFKKNTGAPSCSNIIIDA